MRSRVVTVTLQVEYSIEENDPYLNEDYGVDSIDALSVKHVVANNKDRLIEMVVEADSVVAISWSLGPCLNL